VICYLRDAEEFINQRMQSMRDQDNPAIIGYVQEALARQRNYKTADLQTALDDYTSLRQRMIREFSELTPSHWQRPGQHNEWGHITIFFSALHHAAHYAIHCAQIARQLRRADGG
jgi:hypothetical protein